ncbi:LOW QUALITY PROTEIN: protein OSCP1a [Limanda limanda]|uniref:LOW QUALITY PROTEIN: protein OSCP1a n=1 Tax=Limanda limanda TaxID=27771 RepID=UPI0029C8E257|nr:LOW QUALITY PROTEIN: protein OSCP1a [Limanda limanda]
MINSESAFDLQEAQLLLTPTSAPGFFAPQLIPSLKMSVRTLPLVFINLGGEMIYILDQRLRAPNTSVDNSEKGVWSENDRKRVLNDIVGTLFSKAFIDELLKPQQLYSHRTLKTVLTRLAHASIMRLNPASMDRLYELMVMAFKYQIFLCPRPKDLLLISYNHIDTIREFVKDTPVVVNQVDETHRKIIEVYSSLSEGEFQLLRQTLLIFFQDMHVRVSLFQKNKSQNPNGRFALSTSGPVPHGIDVPGLIRTFDSKGREGQRGEFPSGGSYTSSIREGCFQLHGDRVVRLGLNIYTVNHPEETHTSKAPSVQTNNTPNLLAKEELNLLARLMGSVKAENKPRAEAGFRINLFTTDEEEEEAGDVSGAEESMFGVVNIQAMKDEQASSELALIAGQFTEPDQPETLGCSKGDDLLAMMDDL